MISSASFSHGGTFLPVGFSADTQNGANSAATNGSTGHLMGWKTEADFLNAVNQHVATLMGSAGTNAAFYAKQLNADPNRFPKPSVRPALPLPDGRSDALARSA
jgi:hypothetical protein